MSRAGTGDRRPQELAAAMLRVVLAERTDTGRLMRGRRLVEEGAVTDLTVRYACLSASVQGSLPAPYEVEWNVDRLFIDVEEQRRRLRPDHPQRSVRLVPAASDMRVSCTCVDSSTNVDDADCKHAVAALMAFADQVADDPDVLARWRGVPLGSIEPVDPDDPALGRRPVELSIVRNDSRRSAEHVPFVDPLGDWLGASSPPPAQFAITALAPPDGDDLVDTVLADAIAWMHDAAPW